MKKLITNYTFTPGANSVAFNDYTEISLASVLLITNVTQNVIMYNFAEPTLGGSVADNILSFAFDSTSMSDTDELQIYYDDTSASQAVVGGGAHIERVSFAKAISGGIDPDWGQIIGNIGTGQNVNQASGNLVLTAGTTGRSETIIRSLKSYSGGLRLRSRSILSQRIANNNFFVELVDVVGDGLDYTINSATSMTVTIPNNPFTAENIGQSMYAGGFAGTGTFLAGRYAISAISGDDVTFTVASFAVGSGTLSLFGWNYYHLVYDATTATQAKFDTQRRGYASGDTTVTISTTASPGHLAMITGNDMVAILSDQLVASATGVRTSIRGTRDENVPDDAELFLQVRMMNGATNPATGTTWTIGMIAVSEYQPVDTTVQDLRQTTNVPIPVDILRSVSLTTSTTVTATPATGTNYNLLTAASNNLAFIKASAGNLYEITVSNPTGTPAYIKLYNKTTAPVVASDNPVLTIAIPATAAGVGEKSFNFGAVGKRFATGIAIAVVGGAAANDATNAPVGIQVNATYI